MKFTTHPHKSDTLTLTKQDLFRIERGEELKVSALVIRMEKEPKPDRVVYPHNATYRHENGYGRTVLVKDKLKLVFDGETGELKSAEVL
jgi:hypothetical protein